ncbi:hypothetical protein RchiOBHm_Chr6g0258961 [Rosa chinensis]|uniref:Uncharacterized protein n=1 Tax=Rosa chinensis TaxID=74649 RepID=A0A2P6PMS2_ROSCH|nr:hypothetical protein RchiOBHm_Chr6g0258961 [Rosa chinensis]
MIWAAVSALTSYRPNQTVFLARQNEGRPSAGDQAQKLAQGLKNHFTYASCWSFIPFLIFYILKVCSFSKVTSVCYPRPLLLAFQ